MGNQKPVSKPCSWCSRGGVPGDGNGIFRDVDVDFSSRYYRGIPICGGCGGLGVQYDTPDFKQRTKRIMELRFEFHPTDNLPDPPEILIYQALKKLVRAVKDLVEKYEPQDEDSFAVDMARDGYDLVLKALKRAADSVIDTLENDTPPTPEAVTMLPALKAFYSGNIAKGEELMLKILEDDPTNSVYVHDYGTLVLKFKRDADKALELFIRATNLEPKKTRHFTDTALLLSILQRDAEEYMEKAKTAPDYKQYMGGIIDSQLPKN